MRTYVIRKFNNIPTLVADLGGGINLQYIQLAGEKLVWFMNPPLGQAPDAPLDWRLWAPEKEPHRERFYMWVGKLHDPAYW